jgi:VIT1/CCC1 family predicted Fe2+/Mn2+ transporter
VEDSLVSTVGLISGIAIVDTPRATIILTGVVLIFVEAFSMSIGSLLSDNSAREFEEKKVIAISVSIKSAVIMFFSYFLSGFVILIPYIFWSSDRALPISVAASLVSLFILGIISGRITHTPKVKKGLTMALIGGLAVFAGMVVGLLVNKI